MGKRRGWILVWLGLGLGLAYGHGGYEYQTLSLAGSRQEGRASLWDGFRLGIAFEIEIMRLGYTRAEGRSYVPVNTVLPLALWAFDADEANLRRAGLLNGLRLGFSWQQIGFYVEQHLELYAPHPAISDILELSAEIMGLRASVYNRYSTLEALRGSGWSLGLVWSFE